MKDKKILVVIQNNFVVKFFGEKYDSLSPTEAAEQFKNDFLKEYKSLEKEYLQDQKRNPEEEVQPQSWFSHYLIGDLNIHFNRADLLSYIIYNESYYGGAHGSHNYQYKVIDTDTGKLLKEKDIFAEGYEKELNLLLLNAIAAQNEVNTAEELAELGYFGATELTSNDNFILDDEGITYLYNEYEIAPYVLGAVKVFIPYDKLQMILKEESPVSVFIN